MRVVIAEDLFLLRDGLVRMLEAYDHEIVAAVDNGPELTGALDTHVPDVSVIDVRLPPSFTDEGLQCALEARRRHPELAGADPLAARRAALRTGVADRRRRRIGYLLKDRVFDAEQFVDAVQRVAGGGTAMDPQVIRQLLSRRSQDRPMAALTGREKEVMELMAQGRSNAAIAAQLVVTERAVAKHTANIFGKLGLQPSDDDNRRVLAVLAYLDQG